MVDITNRSLQFFTCQIPIQPQNSQSNSPGRLDSATEVAQSILNPQVVESERCGGPAPSQCHPLPLHHLRGAHTHPGHLYAQCESKGNYFFYFTGLLGDSSSGILQDNILGCSRCSFPHLLSSLHCLRGGGCNRKAEKEFQFMEPQEPMP